MPKISQYKKVDKSKDFKGSLIRIIKNLKIWKYLMLLAIVLSIVSSTLSLFTPDKLKEFTDIISDGLIPNTKKIKIILDNTSKIFYNQSYKNKLINLEDNVSLTEKEKEKVLFILHQLDTVENEKKLAFIINLPNKVLDYLLDDIKVDGVLIKATDQTKTLKLFTSIKNDSDGKEIMQAVDKLPSSVWKVIKPKIDMHSIKKLAIIMAALYILSSIFSFVSGILTTRVSNKFANLLRSKIINKINSLPLKYFDNHETGDILSRITNDVDMIAHNLNSSITTIIASLTLFIGSIVMMFTTNWIMAITAILSSLIGFLLMFAILTRSQKYFNQKQEELGDLNGYIEEMYSGHNIIKVYNGNKEAMDQFKTLNEKLYIDNRKSQFLSGLMVPLMGFIGNFGYVMVCIVGALLTMNDVITFGVIVAFMIYIRLFINPLTQIAQSLMNLQTTVAASERVFEFLDEEEMLKENNYLQKLNKSQVKGNIEFKHVKFGYNPGQVIIKDFNIKVKSGQKIAIVGPTGAGKTTMVNLLMKFYDINNGEILIDGVSTKNLTRENIHELFIMVLQDTWLFEGSIRDNIKFNKDNINDRRIWEALRVVGIDHFVKTLPGDLDYVLGDNETVSQGQKQLLTIARGMIEDAPFLILDEATSNVDTRTEELVQKAMDKLTEGRTSFIIAHRLSTIKNADLILVMNEGNIIEQGTHKELLEKDGFYADLYNSQFVLEKE